MGVLNCYVVKDGQILARDSSLQAGAPFPALVTEDFNVPALELDAILSRVKTDIELIHSEGVVTVRGKRLKIDIPCVVDEPPEVMLPTDGWKPIPHGFCAALKLGAPFILDKLINFGVRLKGDLISVISNRAGIEVGLPGLNATECCVSMPCIEFIAAQDDDPIEYHQEEGAISFRWKGDRWVRGQLLSKPFPSTFERIFGSAGEAYPVEITDEWRDAYQDIAALADDVIEMRSDKMIAIKSTSTIESDIATAISKDSSSYWSIVGLNPVISIATHWNPAAWPKPAAFKGPNFRGIVVGSSVGS